MEAFARHSDPDTSHEAAAAMSEKRITELQMKALCALTDLGGRGINDEIVRISGIDWNTITPRMRPLLRNGFVVAEGKLRSSKTNRQQIIWQITEAGRARCLTDVLSF